MDFLYSTTKELTNDGQSKSIDWHSFILGVIPTFVVAAYNNLFSEEALAKA